MKKLITAGVLDLSILRREEFVSATYSTAPSHKTTMRRLFS